ncbi:MAG: TIGR03617 family F420-dependent LLM class oxidoreductase [Myxococcales bacterium]|nr:MAG: TIGR03617 family F420-dependent LLM class oxidoreductase [Myxococcales bacterium]
MRIETGIPLNDWNAIGPAARKAEETGFDGLVSFEIAADPFIPLAFAATATERVRLGTAIAVCFPRSPMVVANTAWDLHVQSKGRFTLGLGTQVKGHNERRFSVAWSPPLPRLREYVQSLRAIWRCWEKGEKLQYEGEHYRFTLMTPEFSPPPCGLPGIPISIAAVKPAMMRMAGRHCDGVRLHGFATRKYLEQVALPAIEEGLAKTGRDRSSFELWGGGFIATGADDEAVAKQLDWCRYRVAFYGSTRSYHGVLAEHGWDDLGMKLHQMSKEGKWKEMAAEIPDHVLHEFIAIGRHDEIVAAMEKRFGGISDSVTLGFDESTPEGLQRELLQDVRTIPAAFTGFPQSW